MESHLTQRTKPIPTVIINTLGEFFVGVVSALSKSHWYTFSLRDKHSCVNPYAFAISVMLEYLLFLWSLHSIDVSNMIFCFSPYTHLHQSLKTKQVDAFIHSIYLYILSKIDKSFSTFLWHFRHIFVQSVLF